MPFEQRWEPEVPPHQLAEMPSLWQAQADRKRLAEEAQKYFAIAAKGAV